MRAGENLKTEEKSGYLPLNQDTWSLCNWHTASNQVEKNRSCGRTTIGAYLGRSSSRCCTCACIDHTCTSNKCDQDDSQYTICRVVQCIAEHGIIVYNYPARMRKGWSNRFCPSVCLSVTTKIVRSGYLGVTARCKYHYSVGKVGKRTFFGLLGVWNRPRAL